MIGWKACLQRSLSEAVLRDCSIFEDFLQRFTDDFATVVTTNMIDKRRSNVNTAKGTAFEEICRELLLVGAFRGLPSMETVWRYPELSKEQRKALAFRSAKDKGIDLVALDADGNYYAVQCKFLCRPIKNRKTPQGYNIPWQVPFEQLTTCYGLAQCTGPANGWKKLLIMTTAKGVGKAGDRPINASNICYESFNGLSRDVWERICGYEGHRLDEVKEVKEETVEVANAPPIDQERRIIAVNAFLDRLTSKK